MKSKVQGLKSTNFQKKKTYQSKNIEIKKIKYYHRLKKEKKEKKRKKGKTREKKRKNF